jgi:hypothetical protein
VLHLAVPGMVEQEDADARVGQGAGDEVIVLAERTQA